VHLADVEAVLMHLRSLGDTPSVEGPGLTELDHGLQTAAALADTNPDDHELCVAGLVHDLAHVWDGPGQPRHALMGAEAVRPILGDRVADLVAGHVPAKRWLVTNDPAYRSLLSADSIETLAAQGGDMSHDEVAWFESLPAWRDMVALRRADDAAKVPGAKVPDLEVWVSMVRDVAARHCGMRPE
jgi:predicted HD phosphohydrolase